MWLRRYESGGAEALRDRSRRPHVSLNATGTEVVGKIVYLRQSYHFGPQKIAMYLKRYHDVSDHLGWETTYDAEFVALTQLQADMFVTSDRDLARAVSGLVETATIDVLGKA